MCREQMRLVHCSPRLAAFRAVHRLNYAECRSQRYCSSGRVPMSVSQDEQAYAGAICREGAS